MDLSDNAQLIVGQPHSALLDAYFVTVYKHLNFQQVKILLEFSFYGLPGEEVSGGASGITEP